VHNPDEGLLCHRLPDPCNCGAPHLTAVDGNTTGGIIKVMPSVQKIVAALRNSQTNVRYAELLKVCTHYFGKPRQEKTSHAKFETPWWASRTSTFRTRTARRSPTR
jgi:hypothetical protein